MNPKTNAVMSFNVERPEKRVAHIAHASKSTNLG